MLNKEIIAEMKAYFKHNFLIKVYIGTSLLVDLHNSEMSLRWPEWAALLYISVH